MTPSVKIFAADTTNRRIVDDQRWSKETMRLSTDQCDLRGMTSTTTATAHWFDLAQHLGFGDIHIKVDPRTGLHAIIAIHSTSRGPALGGCRCVRYGSFEEAVTDALRLAQGMSYKAAMAGLALGGGKSVLLHPGTITDRQAYFRAFGEFVEELGGRYITAVDSGTSVADMDAVATATDHVASTSSGTAATGDPSPYTAYGVLRAIQAAVKHRLARNDLQGLHVALQGVGQVGYHLARSLHEHGASLTVCDSNPDRVRRARDEFNARIAPPEAIIEVDCDLFAPCALGGALTRASTARLRTQMVVGAANNQLAAPEIAQLLAERGILYAPDYIANAGGLIQIAMRQIEKQDEKSVIARIDQIYDTLMTVFAAADRDHTSPMQVADRLARQRLDHEDTA